MITKAVLITSIYWSFGNESSFIGNNTHHQSMESCISAMQAERDRYLRQNRDRWKVSHEEGTLIVLDFPGGGAMLACEEV